MIFLNSTFSSFFGSLCKTKFLSFGGSIEYTEVGDNRYKRTNNCLLYTSPSPRD